MNMEEKNKKGFKVKNFGEPRSTTVMALSMDDLIKEGSKKLKLDGPGPVSISIDDGTEVNDDECLEYFRNENKVFSFSQKSEETKNIKKEEHKIMEIKPESSKNINEKRSSCDNELNVVHFLEKYGNVVTRLKEIIKGGLDSKNVNDVSRFKEWMENIKEIDSKLKAYNPEVKIALVGDAGIGKSSLINVLLGRGIVLPTSDRHGCTSSVVKISGNSTGTQFEAEVGFFTTDEFNEQIEILDSTLTVIEDDGYTDAIQERERESYAKIKNSEEYANLNTTISIKKESVEEFSKEIKKFIDSNNGNGGLWRIVKQVSIKIPNCDICTAGATFVDLPGLHDSSIVRESISKHYMKNCNAIWIVADILRAQSNKTIEVLKRHCKALQLDGKLDRLTIVCTKTDIFKVDTNEFESKEKELAFSKKQLEDCVTESRKLKAKRDTSKNESEKKQIEEELFVKKKKVPTATLR